MAGFLENTVNRLSSRLSALSRFNVRHEDLLLKNSQAIGFIESQLMARSNEQYGQNEMMRMSMAISDTTSQLRTKAVAFFQLDYAVKRERLRDIAANGDHHHDCPHDPVGRSFDLSVCCCRGLAAAAICRQDCNESGNGICRTAHALPENSCFFPVCCLSDQCPGYCSAQF